MGPGAVPARSVGQAARGRRRGQRLREYRLVFHRPGAVARGTSCASLLVIFEIAPSHVGHNFIFRDAFEDGGAITVRRRDYSQAAVNAGQLSDVNARLASGAFDETIKNYAEYMLPQMYAARYPD